MASSKRKIAKKNPFWRITALGSSGISDGATQHDKYLYGKPKKEWKKQKKAKNKLFNNQKGMTLKELAIVILIMTGLAMGSIPLFHWLRGVSPNKPEVPPVILEKSFNQSNK